MEIFNDLYRNIISDGRWFMILKGIGTTISISFFAVVIGVIIGVCIVLMRMSNNKILQKISSAYIDIVRGTPVVTQLLIINVTIFATVRNSGLYVAIVALGLNSAAYVSEIIRAGISSVDKGQMEAGRSLGFNKMETMRYIIMPQAIKNIFPALGNEFIVLIKETAIVGYIAVEDLTKVGQIILSQTASIIPIFVSAILYFIIIKLFTIALRKIEKKLNESDTPMESTSKAGDTA
ncbi:MAG: amino acid ABC transporter permease [Lachnospirales bacterium]